MQVFGRDQFKDKSSPKSLQHRSQCGFASGSPAKLELRGQEKRPTHQYPNWHMDIMLGQTTPVSN